ncbi:MFS transporter, partial [Candidatus Sumerlaeota bacterium]|nr:MFS transporter [Candidatus Sumerlaeota bacterium]
MLLLLLAASSWILLRRAQRPETEQSRGAPSLLVDEVPLDPEAAPPGPRIYDVRYSPTSITFKIALKATEDPPHIEEPLFFCVPPGRLIRPEILSYRVGDRILSAQSAREEAASAEAADEPEDDDDRALLPDPARALRVRDVGIMRRWALASFELRPAFFSPYRQLASDQPAESPNSSGDGSDRPSTSGDSNVESPLDLVAELALVWDAPFEEAEELPFASEALASSAWGRTVGSLVANPGGLERFQIARPVAENAAMEPPSAPWLQTSGAHRWARLRLTQGGLYELGVEDLMAVGFSASSVRPQAIRLFSRGKPVPLIRVGSGSRQKVYFWNDGAHTQYTTERIYIATIDEDLADPALGRIDPALVSAAPERQELTWRTARLNRDREMRVVEGNFLAIEEMEWVDQVMTEDETVDLPLDFHHYVSPEVPLEPRIRFYFERKEQGGVAPRFKIALNLGDEVLTSFDVAGSAGSHEIAQTISIRPDSIQSGRNDFTIALLPSAPRNVGVPPSMLGSSGGETTLWFNEIEIDYPARPEMIDGRLTLAREPQAPAGSTKEAMATRWTPLDSDRREAFAEAARDRTLQSCGQAGLVTKINDAAVWGLLPLFLLSEGVSVVQIGIVAAVYPQVWGIGQLVSGPAGDRWGRKPLIVGGLLVQAVGIWGLAAAESLAGWVGAAAVLGLGTALVYPTLIAAVGDYA